MSLRIFGAAAALALAACGSDTVVPLKPFSAEGLRGVSIATVSIVNQSASATTEELTVLQNELATQTARCATGPARYDMLVQVQAFRTGSRSKGVLLGDGDEVKAHVSIIDPVSNVVVARYHIDGDWPAQFAERVCRHIFNN